MPDSQGLGATRGNAAFPKMSMVTGSSWLRPSETTAMVADIAHFHPTARCSGCQLGRPPGRDSGPFADERGWDSDAEGGSVS